MVPNEIIATWWCCHCNKSGPLTFYNETSVGDRLDSAKAEHDLLSPGCELDWHEVMVRTDVDKQHS